MKVNAEQVVMDAQVVGQVALLDVLEAVLEDVKQGAQMHVQLVVDTHVRVDAAIVVVTVAKMYVHRDVRVVAVLTVLEVAQEVVRINVEDVPVVA